MRNGNAAKCRDSPGARENSKKWAGLMKESRCLRRKVPTRVASGVATGLCLRVRNAYLPLHSFLLQDGILLRAASNTAASPYRGSGRPPSVARVDANYP